MGSPTIFSARRTKLLTADGLLLSDGSINDNNGLINYIKNGHAEVNTTGWSTFADGATLVDGTGGAPTATFARSTTSPLRGSASFLYTPGTLGDGASCPFTIDDSDKAKVLQISVEYQLSGTITLGDYQVYIYDVTNSQLIQPAPFKLEGTSGTNYKFSCSFQTASNSTSYRLIVWQSVSTAVTLKLDNIAVSPQVVSVGGSVGDWVSFTPTGSWTANVTYNGQWRRVGGNMEIIYRVVASAGPTPSGVNLEFNMPSGYTIDTAKLAETSPSGGLEPVGQGAVLDSGTAYYPAITTVKNSTTFYMQVYGAAGTWATGTSSVNTSTSQPIAFGANDAVVAHATVPISGWSGSQILSSETDTRVCAARYAKSGAQTVTHGSVDVVDFETKTFDTHSSVTTGAAWKHTAQIAGKYKVSASVTTNTVTATSINSQADLRLYKNGVLVSLIAKATSQQTATGVSYHLIGSDEIDLNAGDYFDIRLSNSLGASVSIITNNAYNFITIERLSGPSQIAASETVACKYRNTAGTSLTGAFAAIPFVTKAFDSHSAWDGTNKFTCPNAGKFSVSTSLVLNSVTMTTAQSFGVAVYKNGSLDSYLGIVFGNGGANNYAVSGSTEVDCLAGDYLQIFAYCAGTTPTLSTVAGVNWASIKRVGN